MGITIRQLSLLCGVSTATVSLVLNNKDQGRVAASQREKVLRLAKQHGYRSNRMAKGLAEGRTYRIALAMEGALSDHAIIGQFSFYDRLGLLARELRGYGYSVEIVQVDMSQKMADICHDLSSITVDGVILLNWSPRAAEEVLLSLRERRIPAVASGTTLKDQQFNWTDVDRGAAFADATQRLLSEGHRQIMLLHCAGNWAFLHLKKHAFLKAIREELGVDAAEWVFASPSVSYDEAVLLTEGVLRKMKQARAFLLTDNFFADAVLHTLRRAGLHPGKDCRVMASAIRRWPTAVRPSSPITRCRSKSRRR